ncbi:MAG: hypothetical protein ACPG49_05170, partial [Chitinophagales bacterium]
ESILRRCKCTTESVRISKITRISRQITERQKSIRNLESVLMRIVNKSKIRGELIAKRRLELGICISLSIKAKERI